MNMQSYIQSKRAFTLIEILVVLVVLAIAAAVVIPKIGTAGDAQSVGAARVLQADLDMTRSLAVTSQTPHTLVFNADRTAYKVVANYVGGLYSLLTAVPHPVKAKKTFEVRLAGLNGMGKVRVTAAFGTAGFVTFSSQGDPSAAGTVTLQAGETEMQIQVQALTGRVSVARTRG